MREMNGDYFHKLVNLDEGTVDRQIFVDEDIYKMELERIFARTWNFMCHETQIPKAGDYFLNYIGDDSIIVTRDSKGKVQALLNTCRHRGNSLCRAEMGHAHNFMCPYHGWTYDLEGNLVGVPDFKNFYHEDLQREKWGLVKAAKVESYKGFVFATMDPQAPSLEEYLGGVGRMSLSMVAAHGNVAVVDGIQKYRIDCNWKLAVDNLLDWYHPPVTHASALATGYTGKAPWSSMDHIVALGEYGHAISGPRMDRAMRAEYARHIKEMNIPFPSEDWREAPHVLAELGELGVDQRGHPNIFPNLWVASSGTQLCLRLPRGPETTEIWWFTLVSKDLPKAQRDVVISKANHFFGPAGLFEQDDGDNWAQGTRSSHGVIGRQYPMNFAMNLGRGTIEHDPLGIAHINTHVNEHGQLWIYKAWAEWMAAEDWNALRQNHSRPTGTL